MAGRHLERLREIARQSAARTPRELTYAPVDAEGLPMDARDAATGPALPGARPVETPHGICWRIDVLVPAGTPHGRVAVDDCVVSIDPWLDVLAGRPVTPYAQGTRVVYVDLETTGLSGGAGTVPFMVGIGEATPRGFLTSQYVLPGYASERALLHAVNAHLEDADLLVTFNGRTFDVPVMEMRNELHRLPQAVCDLPHLDMLPAARRLWRMGEDGERSCRLTHLEWSVLGFGRVGDVPGYEIPGRYFAFVRGGTGTLLDPVLLHNRLDLISLAALTAHAQRLLASASCSAPAGLETWGLGTLLERAGHTDAAVRCYRQAVADRWQPIEVRRASARALARLLRRMRRYDEAAEAWRQVLALGGRPQVMREAREALAVHHEHRARDFEEARRHAEAGIAAAIGRAEREAFGRRLARIARKVERALPARPLWADTGAASEDER
jgi:uncharacterized protein YprB with RNaseH-like and TPR domain